MKRATLKRLVALEQEAKLENRPLIIFLNTVASESDSDFRGLRAEYCGVEKAFYGDDRECVLEDIAESVRQLSTGLVEAVSIYEL